jgi:hypothetical protein
MTKLRILLLREYFLKKVMGKSIIFMYIFSTQDIAQQLEILLGIQRGGSIYYIKHAFGYIKHYIRGDDACLHG